METWKLQDAKAKLSELVDRAMEVGPQVITRHGHNAVVVVAFDQYKAQLPATDFKTFLLSWQGLTDDGLETERHKSRETDFG